MYSTYRVYWIQLSRGKGFTRGLYPFPNLGQNKFSPFPPLSPDNLKIGKWRVLAFVQLSLISRDEGSAVIFFLFKIAILDKINKKFRCPSPQIKDGRKMARFRSSRTFMFDIGAIGGFCCSIFLILFKFVDIARPAIKILVFKNLLG